MFINRGRRDGGFDPGDVFVPQKPDGATGETGQAGDFDGIHSLHLLLDEFKGVRRSGEGVLRSVGLGDRGGFLSAGVDLARPHADKTVAREVLTALDGFEEKRGTRLLELGVGGYGRFQICNQFGMNRDQVSLLAEGNKFVASGVDLHGGGAVSLTDARGESASNMDWSRSLHGHYLMSIGGK